MITIHKSLDTYYIFQQFHRGYGNAQITRNNNKNNYFSLENISTGLNYSTTFVQGFITVVMVLVGMR